MINQFFGNFTKASWY